MIDFDKYDAHITVNGEKKVIYPVEHTINKMISNGKMIGIEHNFKYIDENGTYSEATLDNEQVKFIKRYCGER